MSRDENSVRLVFLTAAFAEGQSYLGIGVAVVQKFQDVFLIVEAVPIGVERHYEVRFRQEQKIGAGGPCKMELI